MGKRVGRYELLLPAARGGMAEVWAARLHGVMGFKKLVAIKVMHDNVNDRQQHERMFLEEATLASRVRHPNVVEIFELGEWDGSMYMVMEWIDGESLRQIQKEAGDKPLPLQVAVNLIAQCCRGLHAAHELTGSDGQSLGLVHRDISPHNIMVSYDGVAKVADFGVAKATRTDDELTGSGQVKGKVAYMAPEYLEGEAIDRRADLFALGLVLYELTTGRHPFRGATPVETVRKMCAAEAPAPATIIKGFPPALSQVIQKAVRLNRNQRFDTALELMSALQQAMPDAFTHQADQHTADYLHALLKDRSERRRATVEQALARPTMPPSPPFNIRSSGESGTMGAVTTDELSSRRQSVDTIAAPPPVAQRNAMRPAALGAAATLLMVLAGVGLGKLTTDKTPNANASKGVYLPERVADVRPDEASSTQAETAQVAQTSELSSAPAEDETPPKTQAAATATTATPALKPAKSSPKRPKARKPKAATKPKKSAPADEELKVPWD